MLLTAETKSKLDALLTDSFLLNMQLDNLVYQIDALGYVNMGPIFHESFAHKAPQWADEISTFMNKMNACPIRGNLVADYQDFGGDIGAIFEKVSALMNEYRKKAIEALDIAEFNEDREAQLFMEDFLMKLVDYRKQADEWARSANRFTDDYKSFDVYFEKLTSFIPVIK